MVANNEKHTHNNTNVVHLFPDIPVIQLLRLVIIFITKSKGLITQGVTDIIKFKFVKQTNLSIKCNLNRVDIVCIFFRVETVIDFFSSKGRRRLTDAVCACVNDTCLWVPSPTPELCSNRSRGGTAVGRGDVGVCGGAGWSGGGRADAGRSQKETFFLDEDDDDDFFE